MRMCVLLLTMFLAPGGAAQRTTPASAAACTTSTSQCTEWVTLGGGPGRSMILHLVFARRAERSDQPGADHGPRHQSQRRSLLRDRDGRGLPGRRARRHGRHRAAPRLRASDKLGDRTRSAGAAAATAGGPAARRRATPICRRSTSSTRSCASSPTRTRSRTCRRSSSPAIRPAASS